MSERKSGLGRWHGSASDRGSADAYYWRSADPHFWPDGSYVGTRVEKADMTQEEIVAYYDAYHSETDRKDYGCDGPEDYSLDF